MCRARPAVDFLNGVCTNIMNLNHKARLEYWTGNYDAYVTTRAEKERNQLTKYQKEQVCVQLRARHLFCAMRHGCTEAVFFFQASQQVANGRMTVKP